MGVPRIVKLEERGLITVSGDDRVDFLQGLVTNDVSGARDGKAVWSALLTPQGKYLHDFILVADDDRLLIECEAGERMMDLGRQLHKYKLRSAVALGIEASLQTYHLFDLPLQDMLAKVPDGVKAHVVEDPRHGQMGLRLYSAAPIEEVAAWAGAELDTIDTYNRRRISLGLPEGALDMDVGKSVLLENGFDELGGIDWQKGCYTGQELTARTKYRGLVKKRLVPVQAKAVEEAADATALEPGAIIFSGDRQVGFLRSVAGDLALALVRLDAVGNVGADQTLRACGHSLQVALPDWLDLNRNAEKRQVAASNGASGSNGATARNGTSV